MKAIRKLIWISAGMLFVFTQVNGQMYPSELALKFSRTSVGGSARIMGLGGVNASLGGDITAVSANPAGLGFYNRSEVSLTPVININSNSTSYLGSPGSTSLTSFNMGNLGVVINNTRSDEVPGGWRGGSFGFSYSRINNFRNEVNYAGTNVENDYIDYLLDFADRNEAKVGDFYQLDNAYYTYLLNDFSIDQNGDTLDLWDSFVEFPSEDTPVRQGERIVTSGSQNKWDLSYGGNFNDRFYFGLGLGIVTAKYINEKYYTENRYPESILDNYTLYERQVVDGVGVNANLGIIVRPINTLTLGVNFTTPTAYGFNDEYETSLHTLWNSSADEFYGDDSNFNGDHYEETVLDPVTYNLTTPMRLNAGISYFFNKNGFISGDIEWVDYSKAKVRSNDNVDYSIDNQEISTLYGSVINYRVGGEYRLGALRLRAGYNFQSDPMADQTGDLLAVQTWSGGIGYRKRAFYADFAYLNSTTQGTRAPYIIDPSQEIGPTPVADIEYNRTRLVFTVGFMF